MKIVINKCWGGFGVSEAVYDELNIEWDGYGYIDNDALDIESDNYDAHRADKKLIAAIEKVGLENASANLSSLEIVDIPDGTEWEINNYDGMESVHEAHRSW